MSTYNFSSGIAESIESFIQQKQAIPDQPLETLPGAPGTNFHELLPASQFHTYRNMTGPKTRILMKKQPPERATKGMKPMKKLISIAIILVTVFALMIPVFSSATAEGEREMWINCADGKTLNLRAEPSKQAARLRRLECGTKLIVLNDVGNGWLNVTDGKHTGYVMAKYLQDNKPGKYEITEREDHFTPVQPFTVTAKALNSKTERSVGLRTKPNKTSGEIRRLHAGDQLEVIARGATWSQVLDPQTGKTGYAANDYLQF